MMTMERDDVVEAQNYLSECLWTLTETMEDLGYDVADLDGEQLVDMVCRRLRKSEGGS